MRRRYIEVAGRRILYLHAGTGPPLVMLHGSPGNSEMLAEEMVAAASRFSCYAFDTPGFGGSDPLPDDILSVGDLADATAAAMRALGLPPCPVYGTHTGALIAIELGVRHPAQMTGVVLCSRTSRASWISCTRAPAPDPAVAAAIAPDLPMTLEAAHWVKAWLMVRDRQIYDPWYDGSIATQRRMQGNFDADWLHEQTVEIMKARTSYHRLPRAAWGYDPASALARATVPVRRAHILSLSGASS